MKELRDLYDENKKVTGEKIYKGENIPPNRYILVVTLFIKIVIINYYYKKEVNKKVENTDL